MDTCPEGQRNWLWGGEKICCLRPNGGPEKRMLPSCHIIGLLWLRPDGFSGLWPMSWERANGI